MKIILYDTTLRDGTQSEDINFSVEDKVRIAMRLDELEIPYIEGGWPGSSPRDIEFFKIMKGVELATSQLVAFGSTRRSGVDVDKDTGIKHILDAGTSVITIFGKSWELHVREALRISLEENLDMIAESVHYLKARADTLFYDAEHFFDGYIANPDYALKTIKTAEDAGAGCIVLCDTNGGTLPTNIADIVRKVRSNISVPLGIHAHNDSGTAVANSLVAVEEGVEYIHGTINGFGERCGNADICVVAPNIEFKMGMETIGKEHIKGLREVSRFVDEMGNMPHNKHQPYVGESAFAHKGGVHVSAICRVGSAYEHIVPELVGNHRRVLVSDLAGRSNIIYKAKEFGLDINPEDPAVNRIVTILKQLENEGFEYEGAEASFELLMQRAAKGRKRYFKLHGFRVIDEKREDTLPPFSEATIKLEADGKIEHTAAEGNGPVNALDTALRKALERFYPQIRGVELIDFKVRVITTGKGTAARVRVLVESGDGVDRWGTVGVSENVLEAAWHALVDSLEYKLYKDEKKRGD